MEAVINRRRYDTETATLIADDDVDGRDRFSGGRASSLYRTDSGAYFVHCQTIWEGESDSIHPIPVEEAEVMFEGLPHQVLSFEEAFPDIEVGDA